MLSQVRSGVPGFQVFLRLSCLLRSRDATYGEFLPGFAVLFRAPRSCCPHSSRSPATDRQDAPRTFRLLTAIFPFTLVSSHSTLLIKVRSLLLPIAPSPVFEHIIVLVVARSCVETEFGEERAEFILDRRLEAWFQGRGRAWATCLPFLSCVLRPLGQVDLVCMHSQSVDADTPQLATDGRNALFQDRLPMSSPWYMHLIVRSRLRSTTVINEDDDAKTAKTLFSWS